MENLSNQIAQKMLAAVLPGGGLITAPAALKPYESDGLTALRTIPWAVALPETEAQVREVMQICHDHGIPLVPRGAGTGLSGGARPVRDGLVLSLARLTRILEIDPDNCIARVQPGVRNIALSEAAEPFGLYYAPDPSSQIACTLGGNVAENSGGVHCLKYGLTVHNLLGLRILLANGDCLNIGGAALDTPGAGLLPLLCGSEGMLGVITEITVKLLPIPAAKQVLLACFHSVEAAADAVAGIIGAGIIPAGLEMMDRLAVTAAEAFVHAGYPETADALLLCELDGTLESVAEQANEVSRRLLNAGGFGIRIAEDEAERALLWQGRKAAFPAVGRLAPDYYCMDGTIPRRALSSVLADIGKLSDHYGLRVANVFHAGDGNLHPLILYDANSPGELSKAEAFGEKILELCVLAGGTVTGEHGVGAEKLNPMCQQFTAAELAQFHRLKAAFDPTGMLNPGKGIPTLARCAELGGMHVHGGEAPYPGLERF